MSRSRYAKVNGEWGWFDLDPKPVSEQAAPFIHQDTMDQALRHPVTDEMVDSRTRWNQINKQEGLVCVGNELLSKRNGRGPEKITEEVIIDRIHRAEAIANDPSKLRAYREQQRDLTERNRRLLDGK